MSRTREQLRRRRWLRRIWLAVLAAAVAETIRFWDLTSLEAAMGPPPEEGPRLYAAHLEADQP